MLKIREFATKHPLVLNCFIKRILIYPSIKIYLKTISESEEIFHVCFMGSDCRCIIKIEYRFEIRKEIICKVSPDLSGGCQVII